MRPETPSRDWITKGIDSGALRALSRRVADALSGVRVARESFVHGYYDGLRFMIDARGTEGDRIPLVDGGAFDWLAKLTSNRKAVFVASALGSQLAAHLFRAP